MNTDPERYDRVAAHPDYPGTLAYEPPAPDAWSSVGIGETVFFAVFPIVWLAIALTITLATLIVFGAPLWFAVVAVAAVAALLIGIGRSSEMFVAIPRHVEALRRTYAAAPIERQIMVIVKERSDVSEGVRTSTTYYATLQARDGTRTEYATSPAVAGKLAVGDIGVAFVKSHTLLDFARFDV